MFERMIRKAHLIVIPALALFIACKSAPVEHTAAFMENAEDDELFCIPVYSQEEINLELIKIRRLENRGDYPNDGAYANFREIRTTGIRAGTLFRSSHPAMPGTMPGYAARLSEQARIFTIVNLLDTRAEMVSYAAAVPWYQSFLNRDSITALYTGKDFYEPYFGEKLKAGIQFMLLRRGPYLIHCDDGIEATGFVAMLFEALMGASPEEMIEDYMQSYYNYYGFSEGGMQIISQIPQNMLCALNNGRVVTAANASAVAERYLVEVAGLDSAALAELKQRLGE